MSTLICFAMKEEAGPFRKMVADRLDIEVLVVGIGKKNAEKSVLEFLVNHPKPDLVLTCGFAGGLNSNLKLGDVVFETGNRKSEIGNNPEPSGGGCYDKLIAAGAKPAKFFCADRIATTVGEKKKLRDETGADAVEMESAAIHAVCAGQGIPCVTVRVISDTAHEDLPLDFNQLAKPDQSLDFGKLFLAIAKSPGKIPALMRLGGKTAFAAERLAEVLQKIL